MPGDITIRAKVRVKMIAEGSWSGQNGKTRELYAYNIIQSLFPNNSKDYIILLDDQNTVLIKELKDKEDRRKSTKGQNHNRYPKQ